MFVYTHMHLVPLTSSVKVNIVLIHTDHMTSRREGCVWGIDIQHFHRGLQGQ